MRVSDYELTTLAAGLPPPDGDFDRVLTRMARELLAALAQQPEARAGQRITCPRCSAKHALKPADDGSELLLWYSCGGESYLAAVAGRLVANIKPDVTGSVPCGARDDGTGTEDWSTGTEGEP